MKQANQALKTIAQHVPLPAGKNQHFTQEQNYLLLFLMSSLKGFAEGVSALFTTALPQADSLFFRIQKIPYQDVQKQFDELIAHNIKKARRMNLLHRFVWIAIDFNDQEFYGEPNSQTRGSKPKNGTSTFYSYATASIVFGGCRLVIAQRPYGPLDEQTKIVEQLLDACKKLVRIEVALFDRGFFSSSIIRLLEKHQINYIMPGKHDKAIQRIQDGLQTFPATIEHVLKDQPVQLHFVQVKTKDGLKTLVFCSNLRTWRKNLTEYYARRWGIETAYRCTDDFAAKTCSTHPTVRLFFYYFAVALYNEWVMCNVECEKQKNILGVHLRLQLLLLAVSQALGNWKSPGG